MSDELREVPYDKAKAEEAVLRSNIKNIALSYVGKKEISGNKGFHDPEFAKKMDEVGFQDGWAWCALFGELTWKEGYQTRCDIEDLLDDLFSAGAQKTLRSFKKAGWEIGEKPEVGDIVVFKKIKGGKNTGFGHLAIVISGQDSKDVFETVDGNTGVGDKRDGDGVGKNKWTNNYGSKGNGLIVAGFIKPTVFLTKEAIEAAEEAAKKA